MIKLYFILIIITTNFLISNRQYELEKNIQCPCNKGLLVNHASENALILKKLISELVKDSISLSDTQSFILKTQFYTKVNDNISHQDCLIRNIKLNMSDNKISNIGIYNIISECYGKHLVRNKDNSLLYIILFSIITIGLSFSSIFIIKNKSRDL